MKGLQDCRVTGSDKYPKKRRDQDQRFELTVRDALLTRHCALTGTTQQAQPHPGFPPDHWGPELNDEFPFGINLDIYSSQPYPSDPAYGTHTNLGFDGSSHIPAPNAPYTSSEDASQTAPQRPSMNNPYGAMQNGRPCPTAGRSAHRSSAQYSSGLSSQPSRDSGDLRTLETQDTQFTQYTQEQDAALPPHADNGGLDNHRGACNCSTSPGSMPFNQHSCSVIAGQDPSDLNFVGARPLECPDGSNSDEDLGPVPNMQSSFGAHR